MLKTNGSRNYNLMGKVAVKTTSVRLIYNGFKYACALAILRELKQFLIRIG